MANFEMVNFENLPVESITQLPILPDINNLRFRTQKPMKIPQHVLLDNLWSSRTNYPLFLKSLKALEKYFDYSNDLLIRSQSQAYDCPDQAFPSLSLRPQGQTAIRELEWKNKMLKDELEIKKKDIEILDERFLSEKKELMAIKSHFEKERKEQQERLELFPPEINEAKKMIQEKVMRGKYEEFLEKERLLIKLALNQEDLPEGLGLSGEIFAEPPHKHNGCICSTGYKVIQCSFDLSKWTDQEVKGQHISFTDYLEDGFVSRIIMTKEEQLEKYRFDWQIEYIIHKVFKSLSPRDFLNMQIISIPPGYETGYPDAARHTVVMTLIRDSSPRQHNELPEMNVLSQFKIDTLDMDMKVWRSMALARKTGRQSSQIFENRSWKIYLNWPGWISVPFSNTIAHYPAVTQHFAKIKAWKRLYKFGDYEDHHINYEGATIRRRYSSSEEDEDDTWKAT